MNRLTIVKVGGKVIENPDLLKNFLFEFTKISGNKILVHGGGTSATELANKLGIPTKMVQGRRITDEASLNVIVMVYAGLINKRIVSFLHSFGSNAAGFTGADFDLIRSRIRKHPEIDFGYVGDIENVNTDELRLLLEEGVVPVIAPVTHDGKGQLLNTNADTIASEMAKELSNHFTVYLLYCFEKKGVLADPEDNESALSHLSFNQFQSMVNDGIISSGMIPKLENGFNAKKNGIAEVIITNTGNISTGKGTRLTFEDIQ
ncbi:MAG: acetylglutamate kinase [Prolixibacteraceae bacterium]|nr:acetylglutamate kinase [Prolixibacteraceae bacterium]